MDLCSHHLEILVKSSRNILKLLQMFLWSITKHIALQDSMLIKNVITAGYDISVNKLLGVHNSTQSSNLSSPVILSPINLYMASPNFTYKMDLSLIFLFFYSPTMVTTTFPVEWPSICFCQASSARDNGNVESTTVFSFPSLARSVNIARSFAFADIRKGMNLWFERVAIWSPVMRRPLGEGVRSTTLASFVRLGLK